MKDRFDRNDPAWEDMLRIVRGEGPLRPDKARELGCGENPSPLFRLYQTFRRSSPKPKVAGAYAKLLVVLDNEQAGAMARSFYAGEQEYQTDEKWYALVEEADRQLLVGGAGGKCERPPRAGHRRFHESYAYVRCCVARFLGRIWRLRRCRSAR